MRWKEGRKEKRRKVVTLKSQSRGSSQDRRIGGCGIRFASQIHQEYINEWNNSQRASAEH